jgi:hypothetical protein
MGAQAFDARQLIVDLRLKTATSWAKRLAYSAAAPVAPLEMGHAQIVLAKLVCGP